MTGIRQSSSSRLIDGFGRRIEYVRLSVADKCNLRCVYCMPKRFTGFEQPDNWLTFDENERVIRAFAGLGVRRVRLTGGEPLVRKDIATLAARLHGIDGVDDLSLSTNAVLLDRHAEALRDAGVSRINVSLDSLKESRFREITGGELQPVLNGLSAAHAVGLAPIKINMVVMKGVNDDEVESMVEYCAAHGFTLRFIETMPMGNVGQDASASHFVDLGEIRERLARRFELVPEVLPGGGPARYYRVNGSDACIGFITPISQHFCETCNRVRVSVDGTLHLCLGQKHSIALRPLFRDGISDNDLRQVLVDAIALKPERHEFREKPGQIVRFMSMTGG